MVPYMRKSALRQAKNAIAKLLQAIGRYRKRIERKQGLSG